ncbi:MAG: class B sortase [Pseudobutyrivibrio sp.]|nr:class B sortase [Pseudobutyrivibrio sp.]
MSDKKKFAIGGYEFDSFHEYKAAQEDVKKIEAISQELDVQDPEVALRLYNDIRDGIIVFTSPIGKQYASHVADIVAHKSAGLLDNRDIIEEAEDQAKGSKMIGLALVGLAVLLIGTYAGVTIHENFKTKKIAEQTAQAHSDNKANEESKAGQSGQGTGGSSQETPDIDNDNSAQPKDITEDLISSPWDTTYNPEDRPILSELQDLYNTNDDLVGVLDIVDADINYPVVQTISDPEYYLRRDFYGNDATGGTLFVDYRCDIVNPTTNTIIYGHNMRSGTMFGGLKRFLDREYYDSHKKIIFKTLYEEQEYEIVGVGLSTVGYDDDSTYKYYNFINAVTGAELQEFLDAIQSMSVYDETIDISAEDKILTLSTCNSYTEDGRMFIVAKRVK